MVMNLRNSSQPDDTDTVDVRALIRVSVAHFNSARNPDIVPTVVGGDTGRTMSQERVHVYTHVPNNNTQHAVLAETPLTTHPLQWAEPHIYTCAKITDLWMDFLTVGVCIGTFIHVHV